MSFFCIVLIAATVSVLFAERLHLAQRIDMAPVERPL
jgi:hypothetical protein